MPPPKKPRVLAEAEGLLAGPPLPPVTATEQLSLKPSAKKEAKRKSDQALAKQKGKPALPKKSKSGGKGMKFQKRGSGLKKKPTRPDISEQELLHAASGSQDEADARSVEAMPQPEVEAKPPTGASSSTQVAAIGSDEAGDDDWLRRHPKIQELPLEAQPSLGRVSSL